LEGEDVIGMVRNSFSYCGTKANDEIGLRFSATNSSRLYDYTMTDRTYFQPSEWGLSNRLTTNHIWDGFVILSLMEDAVVCSRLLRVPHIGSQADRFKLAMEERNNRIILNGQPDAVRHACDRCMRIFSMPDGSFGENSS
jgi:hypothetical protein